MGKDLRIEIICIGSELLTSKVNTHTVYLGQKLSEIGFSIAREHAVGDHPVLMREVFSEAFRRSDVVISCGGLGPTFDDITREVWSNVLKRKLVFDRSIFSGIKKKFATRGIGMPSKNRRQAFVLRGGKSIANANGTAPGQFVEIGKKLVVLLPGPSRELYPMVEEFVIPLVRSKRPPVFQQHMIYRLAGISESQVDEWVRPWVQKNVRYMGCRVVHGILASNAIVSVKFMVEGKVQSVVKMAMNKLKLALKPLLGSYVFGEGDDTLAEVIGRLLIHQKKNIAIAESCTGGLISKLITDVPGASSYFKEGIVTYQNEAKTSRLRVASKTLLNKGAVSKETASEMAFGLRKSTGVSLALSVTGIAGPGGGSEKKPVGLVFIGLSTAKKTAVHKFQFGGDRDWIRHRAAMAALNLIRKELLKRS